MSSSLSEPTASPKYDPADRRTKAWYVDKAVQLLVFIGGISGIVFVVGIFVFVTREGIGFVAGRFEFGEFFGSLNWRPTSANPTYGALALIVGIDPTDVGLVFHRDDLVGRRMRRCGAAACR